MIKNAPSAESFLFYIVKNLTIVNAGQKRRKEKNIKKQNPIEKYREDTVIDKVIIPGLLNIRK